MISFLRRYVFQNFALKLVAVAAAVLLWGGVARDQNAELAVTVPIEFHRLPQDIEIISDKVPEAQVWVRGPSRVLRRLAQSEVHASLDLTGVRPGERTFELTERVIRVPRELTITQVTPARLHLQFDRTGKKEVPIRPTLLNASGEFAVTEPSVAVITGPEKRLESIAVATTDPVDAAAVQSRPVSARVYVSDPRVRVVSPASVNVIVNNQLKRH